MWFAILGGLIVYGLFKLFFAGDDDVMEVETSDFNAIFSVASRFEKLYGGKAYVGLRIPDADTGSRQNIDLVVVTREELLLISVKNLSGFVSINSDGSWVCDDGKHKAKTLPDPVEETKQLIPVLESYLEQRGVGLPAGYLSCKVVLPNPKFRTIDSGLFPSEVITYDQWMQLKPEHSSFSGWMKGKFRGKKELQEEPLDQKLKAILGTAPMWDKLELKGKYILGDFLEFKGKEEDIDYLRDIKRSKISHLTTQKTSMLGFAPTRLQVLYAPRDYRSGGAASASEWREVTVRSSTEILFQPQNSTKVRKFELSSVISLTLSA
ncbi:unnamed protein product [Citrullus colocynthis]|uniref:NERD domain-containing protein n=1 Tax=Citrullus colocynthis TaxID=252529 RepID=A0ABP0XND1_9ROSI